MTAFWTLKVSSILGLFLALSLPTLAATEVKIEGSPSKGNVVSLEVSVTDNGEPIDNLQERDFKVLADGRPQKIVRVTPFQASATPTNLVILLDTSNSMEAEDSTGIKRKQGAIEAIRGIQETFKNAPVRVKLIPFGEGGSGCRQTPSSVPLPVGKALQSEEFLSLENSRFSNKLDRLESLKFCTSTDLYTPLIETLDYLGEEQEKPASAAEKPARFAIILLSDGFHSYNRTCSNNTEIGLRRELGEVAQRVNNIPIYTIGYGLTRRQLRTFLEKELNTPNPPLNAQDFICQYEDNYKFSQIAQKFIDHQSLNYISKLTGGDYQPFETATEVAATIEKFVKKILGKYEVEYVQKPAEPGQPNSVVVEMPQLDVRSEAKTVTLNHWSYYLFSGQVLAVFAVLGVGGLIVWGVTFLNWSKSLKKV